jgi:hypothetical protein
MLRNINEETVTLEVNAYTAVYMIHLYSDALLP